MVMIVILSVLVVAVLVLLVCILCNMVAGTPPMGNNPQLYISSGEEFPTEPQKGMMFCKYEDGEHRLYVYNGDEWSRMLG